jgi:hypothetical protein
MICNIVFYVRFIFNVEEKYFQRQNNVYSTRTSTTLNTTLGIGGDIPSLSALESIVEFVLGPTILYLTIFVEKCVNNYSIQEINILFITDIRILI